MDDMLKVLIFIVLLVGAGVGFAERLMAPHQEPERLSSGQSPR